VPSPHRVYGLIPARGGSKGIPDKNLRLLGGRPLLSYSVEAARMSGTVDYLVLTTDSEKIADQGRELGIDNVIMRPPELALDDTPMLPVVQHALRELAGGGHTVDILVLLQPTAPLRRPDHILHGVEILIRHGCDSVVSVVKVPSHLSPHYVMMIRGGFLLHFLAEGENVTRRQDVPPAYYRDGTIYVMWEETVVQKQSLYGDTCMPMILPSEESQVLDSIDDWNRAERLLDREQ